MKRLFAIPMRAPRATLAVVSVLTIAFGFLGRSLEFDSSMETLVAAGSPDLMHYQEVREAFGGEDFLVVGVFADDVFAPTTLEKIASLSTALSRIDGVREVVSLSTIETVTAGDLGLASLPLMARVPATAEEATTFRNRLRSEPWIAANIVSPDDEATSITLFFDEMTEREFDRRGIEDQLRRMSAAVEGPEQFVVTGVPSMRGRGTRMLEEDRNRFVPLAALVTVLVLTLTFRTLRGVLLPLLPVLVAVAWTSGFMALMGSPIDMGTVIVHPLIIAVGVAYAIHLVCEYEQQAQQEVSRTEMILATVNRVRMPTAVAALTTLFGFVVLSLNPIPAIRRLGVFAVFGITVTLLATFTVLPAVLALLPVPRKPTGPPSHDDWLSRALSTLVTTTLRRPRVVFALVAACSVWSLYGIGSIEVDTDFVGLFGPNSEVRREHDLFTARMGGTQPMYVVIDGDSPGSVTRIATLDAIRDIEEFVRSKPGVDMAVSLVDYLETVRGALVPEAGRSRPESQAEVDQMLLLIDPAVTRRLVSRDFSRANIAVRSTLSGSGVVRSFVERVEAFAQARLLGGLRAKVTGRIVLLHGSAHAVTRSQIVGIAQMLVLVFLAMCALFLSPHIAALSLLPNALPVLMLFGLMGWSGIPLNVSTGMIAAIAIGIAVDDTIHYLSRFKAELRDGGSQSLAAVNAIQSVGRPMVVTSMALSGGFLVVCSSHFEPIRHFGYLASATIMFALLADLIITPTVAARARMAPPQTGSRRGAVTDAVTGREADASR